MKYEKPEWKVIEQKRQDIVRTSQTGGYGSGDGEDVDDGYFD